MNKIFYFIIVILLFSVTAYTQSFTVYGKVVSAQNNAPLVGIKIKLSQGGSITQSALDGSFRVNVSHPTDTIHFYNTGYLPLDIPISSNSPLPLLISLMDDIKVMDEIVINTGYQAIAKERATGSFSSINKQLFNQQSGPTVLDRLESIANGLYIDRQTNGGSKIVIRGLSTIQGPRAPLIILDDFPYEGNIDNINPNEVENITILKDAAAASIWGTRAGNGVIVITTKKGRYNQPVKVEFSSNILVTQKPGLNYIKDISSADYTGVEKFLYAKGFYTSQLTAQPWLAVSPVVHLLRQRDIGLITAAQAESGIADIGTHSLRDDMNKYVYKKGFNLQQAITIRGGSKTMNWNLSGGWDHNSNTLDANYNRYNFRSGQTFRLTKQLEITTGIDYTQSETGAGRLGYGALKPYQGNLPVYTQLADAGGNALPVIYRYRNAYTDTAGAGKLLDWKWYPLSDYQDIDRVSKLSAILANINVSYKLKNSLGLSFKYQYGNQSIGERTVYGSQSYFARDMVNQFTQLNRSTGLLTYRVPKGGVIDNALSSTETHNVRGQVNFSKIKGIHGIDMIAGAEYRQINNDYRKNRSYGYNPAILGYSSVDYITMYPNFLSGSQSLIPEGSGFSGTLYRYISFFANAAYTYKGRYTLSASARRDASNLFGASGNNRWSPLWSVGAAWDISKEKFYSPLWLPQLKFRASYGSSGNADPLRSAVSVIQYNNFSQFTQLPTASIAQFSNPGLRWEKVNMLNTAVDFVTKGSRFSGSVEYYYKKGTNLFGTSPVDYTALAFNTVTKNVASIAGHGWDIALSSRNLSGSLGWTSQLNLNFNKDKVLVYNLTNKQAANFLSGLAISAVQGKPVYGLYVYKWAGLDPQSGDPRGYVKGAVSKDYFALAGPDVQVTDLTYIGPTLPTTVASLGNTFSYKNISLTFRITGKFGHYFQRSSIDYSALFTNRAGHSDYALRWQQPGDELRTNVPSIPYPANANRGVFYRYSEALATKAAFIRLQYITLNYALQKPAIQFYINANNLGLLWRANHFGIDPEYNNGLPPSINVALGLRAIF